MKKVIVCYSFVCSSLFSYSQDAALDSLFVKSFCLQIDLPGLASFEMRTNGQNMESNSYAPNLNISFGYALKKDLNHKFKKTILLNFLDYNSSSYVNLFHKLTTYSATYNYVKHYSVSPELKILFDKNLKKRGLFTMVGVGYSRQKVYGGFNKLYEDKMGWNLIVNAGYQVSKKNIYFEFNFGINNFFVPKANDYKINQGNLTEEEYFNWMQTNYPNSSLQSVKFKNADTVTLKYKIGGLMNNELLPVAGINFGIRF